jgi:hypothetical protein
MIASIIGASKPDCVVVQYSMRSNSLACFRLGSAEERVLITGLHRVADVHCLHCDKVVGWKYEKAREPSQKYKEGKFILEMASVMLDDEEEEEEQEQEEAIWH